MKIVGQANGNTFSFQLCTEAERQIASTPNNEPKGRTAEEEMAEITGEFLGMLELAFAAPEPLRREFVLILKSGLSQIRVETLGAIGTVSEVFEQRVTSTN